MQVLMSRLVETRGTHRIIAGTGDDLAAAVGCGTFSPTLFYRLNAVHLVIRQPVAKSEERW